MPKQMITSISQMIIFINHNQIIAYNWNSSCKNLNHSKYLCKSSLYLLGNCCRHFQISTWLATISEYIIWMQTITNKKILHSMEMDNRLASCTVYKTNYVSILRTSCRISYGWSVETTSPSTSSINKSILMPISALKINLATNKIK